MHAAAPYLFPCRTVSLWLAAALVAAAPGAAFGEPAPAESDIAKFCANVGATASDARVAWEAKTLAELKEQVVAQTAALEAKRAELQTWVERREAFRKLAEETIVDIYARMRPDAAAVQLAALDAETAAAVLVRLNPRVASAIMAEMDTPRAVDLAAMIAAVGAPNPAETAKQ